MSWADDSLRAARREAGESRPRPRRSVGYAAAVRSPIALSRLAVLPVLLGLVAAAGAACGAPSPPAADAAAGTRAPDFGPGAVLHDVAGRVVRLNDEWYGLVPDADPGTRFAPDALDGRFRRDGLRVVFSGTVGDADDAARSRGRRWGTPLRLAAIRVAP